MAYFVVYRLSQSPSPSNVILRRTHPIVWAANPPPAAREAGMVTTLLWWTEIPDEVIAPAEKWCVIED
jgi:hypothetical protein